VCAWLCVACGIFKRRASSVTNGWDDEVRDTLLQRMMFVTMDAVLRHYPADGDWYVDGWELNGWVNSSSLATGVALERYETVLKVACWLRPEDDTQHINLAEQNVILKGINSALQWQGNVLHARTVSVCVYQCVSDTLTGKALVRTKAAIRDAHQKATKHTQGIRDGV